MKKIMWALIAAGIVIVLVVVFRELQEKGLFSSTYAAPPEKPAPLQVAGQAQTFNFDSDKTGEIPAGFHGARTGQGTEGKWAVTADSTAPSKPNVVAQTSRDRTDYRFPLLIADKGSFTDLELSARFKAVEGEADRAGGLV